MSGRPQVLVLAGVPADARAIAAQVERTGIEADIFHASTEAQFRSAVDSAPDLILSDSGDSPFDGFAALGIVRASGLNTPFILISRRKGEDLAVDAMKRGATDYFLHRDLHGGDTTRLGNAIRGAIGGAMGNRQERPAEDQTLVAAVQEEERYRLLANMSADCAWCLRLSGAGTFECEWASESFGKVTGFDPAEINARGWSSLYHSEDAGLLDRHVARLLSGEQSREELRIVARDGTVRWASVSERPIFALDGAGVVCVAGVLGAAREITQQKELEEQLRYARRLEAVGQLASGVTHDFNNLLTVVCGFGELLIRQPELSADSFEFAGEILEAARRATKLARQLLSFGRSEGNAAKPVDLNEIVAENEKMLRRLIGEHIEIEVLCEARPGMVMADRGRIEQVIANLAVNARDAMPDGGRLTIATSNAPAGENASEEALRNTGVRLTVADTGCGMDKETAARVFEPFFTTKGDGKGTGLGLATVKGIVKECGGEIAVRTEPGQGAAFTISLPGAESRSEDTHEPAPFDLRLFRGAETILVLEDEAPLRALVRRVLRRAGHEVLETGDPEEAIRIAESHPGEIALLIADMVLPKMNGIEAAARVVSIRPSIKVAYTSGYAGEAEIPESLRRFGETFIEKPFAPETLMFHVRNILGERNKS